MSRFRRAASALIVSTALVPLAAAQAPSNPPAPSGSAPGAKADQPRAAGAPASPRRRSIVHHYPYPYPGYYHGDQTAGYRNPSRVGRYAEYYPPGNQFQVEQDPVRVAKFDSGGGPNWDEQRAAQQVGIQRYNSIQQSIDNYARPYYGYGFGVGYFGGFN